MKEPEEQPHFAQTESGTYPRGFGDVIIVHYGINDVPESEEQPQSLPLSQVLFPQEPIVVVEPIEKPKRGFWQSVLRIIRGGEV